MCFLDLFHGGLGDSGLVCLQYVIFNNKGVKE